MLRTTPLSRKSPLLQKSPLARKSALPHGRGPRATHRKAHTKDEDRHLAAVADLGCYCCFVDGLGWQPARVHHSRTRPDGQSYGRGQRASHFETFGLCDRYHANDGVLGESLHAGSRSWAARYGSELLAIAWVRERLGLDGGGV